MPRDKNKQKKAQHESYLRNKEVIKQRLKISRRKNKTYVENYKNQHPCAECEEDNVACKDLHHLRDKEINVSRAIQHYGLDRLKKEIDKCQVFCANCHKKLHGWPKVTTKDKKKTKNRKFITEYRKDHPCEICGETSELCLEFHHLGKKEIGISRAICDWGIKRLKKEVSKCMVLCANCHRKIHYIYGV